MEGSKDQPENKRVDKAQQFIDAYNALCKEMGYQIIVNPAYVKRDDGSFSTVLQTGVGEISKQELEKE